jgi:hypothetical protein
LVEWAKIYSIRASVLLPYYPAAGLVCYVSGFVIRANQLLHIGKQLSHQFPSPACWCPCRQYTNGIVSGSHGLSSKHKAPVVLLFTLDLFNLAIAALGSACLSGIYQQLFVVGLCSRRKLLLSALSPCLLQPSNHCRWKFKAKR